MSPLTCKVGSSLSQSDLVTLEAMFANNSVAKRPWWEIMDLAGAVTNPKEDGWPFNKPFVLYEAGVDFKLEAKFEFGGVIDVMESIMGSGRANYLIIQRIVAGWAGLEANSEGSGSDLISSDGSFYEVKAFLDVDAHPGDSKSRSMIHTASSNTFGGNSKSPGVKKLLKKGKYREALAICKVHGYDKNDFYLYTNTRQWRSGTPFRYVILPKDTVLAYLCPQDPRLINRMDVLSLARSKVSLRLPKDIIKL